MATAPKAAGIMDLPENEDMNQAPQLSPMESYDAVTTALNTASPDAAAQYEQTMNMSLPPELMEMSAEEISQILQLFQYLQENPEEYPAAIADLVEEGVIDAGDLPPEYDEEVLATVNALLMQALRTKQGGMPQQPQGFAMGGIADAARIVANQGRGQDTMLAHITPEEAQLLRSRGGMGTINPMTGLREYGWFKKTFGFSSSKIPGVSAVKKIAAPLVKVAKEIVKSPIGRIVATVALTTFLGPAGAAMGGGFFGAAAAAGVAGTSIGLLSGQSLKDSLISGATAYFGAPGGPVANFVGQAGITSIAGQAAAASGLVGAAAGLARGQSLKDSIKSGLTQAAIGGGSAIVSNYMAQADGSKSLMDAVNKQAPVLTPEGVAAGEQAPVENKSIPRQEGAPVIGSGEGVQPQQRSLTEAEWQALDPNKVAPVTDAAGVMPQAPAGMRANMTPNAMGGPVPSSGGIGSLVDGAKNLYQGGKDLYNEYLSPSGIAAQGEAAAQQAGREAVAAMPKGSPEWMQASVYKDAVDAARPGIISQYGPLAAAGLGATALMGGFERPETPDSQMKQDMYGTPGLDRINADPNKYIIQNLPGVNYTEQGNIAGSGNWAPGQTLDDIRISGNTTSGRNLRGNIYTPPMYSPTGSGGGGIAQPYNQRNMYDFMPRYAAQGGMMSGGIANLAGGGYPRRTGQIEGPGTEKSDSIPAMLSDGEFVMTAGAVRGAGNGSRRAGAKKMYALMHQLEQNAARG